jgi:hypothetical protein
MLSQNINRVDHVVFMYKLENIEQVVKKITAALGINDFGEPREIPGAVRMYISWSSGLEFVAPLTSEDNAFNRFLAKRGEGFFALMYGVSDIDEAMRRVAGQDIGLISNITLEDNVSPPGEPVIVLPESFDKERRMFTSYKEKWLEEVCGIYFGLIEAKPT